MASILDTVLLRRDSDASDGDTEQLAPDDPAPRGEDRDGFLVSLISGGSSSRRSTSTVATDTALPPAGMADDHESYYHHPLVKASYSLFADTVLEPGIRVTASKDGETDEEMQEALRLWSKNAAIHAGQTGQDLSVLLHDLITHRPSKGTQFMELVGTESDPDSLAALMLHKPETFKQFRRENQNLLVQPDDNVDRNHPMTPSGEAAAYVQYDDALTGYADYDAIPFAQGDLVKFVYDPADPVWLGTGEDEDGDPVPFETNGTVLNVLQDLHERAGMEFVVRFDDGQGDLDQPVVESFVPGEYPRDVEWTALDYDSSLTPGEYANTVTVYGRRPEDGGQRPVSRPVVDHGEVERYGTFPPPNGLVVHDPDLTTPEDCQAKARSLQREHVDEISLSGEVEIMPQFVAPGYRYAVPSFANELGDGTLRLDRVSIPLLSDSPRATLEFEPSADLADCFVDVARSASRADRLL